jgi:hypothetical protein
LKTVVSRSYGRAGRIAALLGALLLPRTALPMLAGPQVLGLAVGSSEVAVQVGPNVLFFDHEGTFRRQVTSALPLEHARLIAFTDDRLLWFTLASTDEGGDGPTTLAATDDAGAVVSRETLPAGWTAYVSPGGKAFSGRSRAGRLRIERLGADGAGRSHHADVPLGSAQRDDAQGPSWAVHDDGDIFVLLRESDRGRVIRFRPDGRSVRTWEVAPDPVTSVSYMKDVLLDADGIPYATHGSWEVSSSTGNSGSVLRLDPAGGEPVRIKDGIGYLQHVAVAPSGDVFVSDLSEQVVRFSRNGERAAAWIAVPPRFGESWEERGRRIAAAGRVGADAAVSDLVMAIVYGDREAASRASGVLRARGPSVLSEVTSASTRFRGEYSLALTAEALWTAHPVETVRLFEGTKEEPVRRLLAPFLAYREPLAPGVREVLARMLLEGNTEVGYALDHVGPTPEVIQARIAAFRRSLRSGEPSFDAAYSLQNTYASSIGALEAILLDGADPDRPAVRAVMLEGSCGFADPDRVGDELRAVPRDVLDRSQAWSRHADTFVRETAAIALTCLGVTGHETAALAAARRTPDLALPTLGAFAGLAREHGDAVTPHVAALSRLARDSPAGESRDALEVFSGIRHPAVVEECLRLLEDETLPAERRGGLLLGVDPAAIPRARLLGLLREQRWQRSLAREYFYHSFLEKLSSDHAGDADVRAEMRTTLLALVSDRRLLRMPAEKGLGKSPGVQALHRLADLVDGADLPRLVPLLDDPQLAPDSRAALVEVLSRFPADDALRERLRPLLRDPDLALGVAEALGRAGDRAALEVLVEQGLKRLGFYSRVTLEIESFRPLGGEAEQALLALLDYPNRSTREAVRQLLVEWPSAEGRRRLRGELDEAVASGRAPETGTLAALALAGEDVTPSLVKLASAHPEAVDELTPEYTAGPLTRQLEDALARETEPGRRRLLGTVAARLCGCDGE